MTQPGEAGEEEEEEERRPPQSRSPAPTERRQRPPGPAMARRAAAVLLLLALGCLLGILLLCLGSGDTRGPPSFKVSRGGRGTALRGGGPGSAPRAGRPCEGGRLRDARLPLRSLSRCRGVGAGGRRAGSLQLHCGARSALLCENELLFFFFIVNSGSEGSSQPTPCWGSAPIHSFAARIFCFTKSRVLQGQTASAGGAGSCHGKWQTQTSFSPRAFSASLDASCVSSLWV